MNAGAPDSDLVFLRRALIANIQDRQKDIVSYREALSAALDLLADQDRRLAAKDARYVALLDQHRALVSGQTNGTARQAAEAAA